MKKLILVILAITTTTLAMAQKQAEIVFEKDTIDFGQFSEKEAVQNCVFHFTNTGDAPLIINQAVATCGCTDPKYDLEPVKPGEKGEIKVTYNGRGKLTGPFTKVITVRTNAKTGIKRLYIKGDMTR